MDKKGIIIVTAGRETVDTRDEISRYHGPWISIPDTLLGTIPAPALSASLCLVVLAQDEARIERVAKRLASHDIMILGLVGMEPILVADILRALPSCSLIWCRGERMEEKSGRASFVALTGST